MKNTDSPKCWISRYALCIR